MNLYQNPKYYELAFSFRNIHSEVNFFEKVIKKFSKITVIKVLELASGNSPYLEEWYKRGYKYFGLDIHPRMLNFARSKAEVNCIDAKFFQGDMNHFSLGRLKIDLVYVLLGSLYTTSNNEFLKHLDCVSRVLRKGGLYILDGVIWFNFFNYNKQRWNIYKNGIKITTTYRTKITDPILQTFQENLTLDINEHGLKKQLHSNTIRKFFFPQEFLSLIKCHGKFEFIGWFNNFDINKPVTSKGRQIVILRKR